MPTETLRTGGCLCGAVRYELRGEPYVTGVCHCTTCRKLTGGPYSATANWRRDLFTLHGTVATYEKRQFCPTCGSRLFFLGADSLEVFLGTLDDAPNSIAPQMEIFCARREPWLAAVPGIAQHVQSPPKS